MPVFPVVQSLNLYMHDSGVPYRITSTYRPGNPGSFHSQGLAVDFAGPTPGELTEALTAVYTALRPLGRECLELIYFDFGWKNGVPHQYPRKIRDAHRNHVHIAMPADWRWPEPAQEQEQPPWPIRILPLRPWSGLFRRLTDRAIG